MDMDYRPNTAINRSLPLTERNLRLLDEEQRVLPVAVISQVGHINGHDGPSGEADRAVVNDRADPGPLKVSSTL